MKKRVNLRKCTLIVSLLMILGILTLSSCDVPEYKTQHESGTYKINNWGDFERLLFYERAKPEDLAKVIPGFCIYECIPSEVFGFFSDKQGYMARATINMDGLCESEKTDKLGDRTCYIVFNADKEFDCWYIEERSDNDIASLRQILSNNCTDSSAINSTGSFIDHYYPFGKDNSDIWLFLMNTPVHGIKMDVTGLLWFGKK